MQKTIELCYQQRENIKESAFKARSIVSKQIVELCNALIRRGNDLAISIDLAEDSMLGSFNKLEKEVKFMLEKVKKVYLIIKILKKKFLRLNILLIMHAFQWPQIHFCLPVNFLTLLINLLMRNEIFYKLRLMK